MDRAIDVMSSTLFFEPLSSVIIVSISMFIVNEVIAPPQW